MQIEFTDEIFNDAYEEAFNFDGRELILYGSAGSGKSVFAAQKTLIRVMREDNHRILFSRKIAKTIRDSQFQLYKDIVSDWGVSHLFKFNKSEMDIQYLPKDNWLISFGLDDVEKLKSITGITSVWIEEATEISHDDYKQINLRLRGQTKNYKQIILTLNPIDDEHWINTKFFRRTPVDTES